MRQAISSWCQRERGCAEPRVSVKSHHVDLFSRILPRHRIYLVEVEDKTHARRELILKILDSEMSAREENNRLAELNRYFNESDTRFGVPIPFAVFPQFRGLLMSRAPGKRLDKILWPSWFPFTASAQERSAAVGAVQKASSWLAIFDKSSFHAGRPHILEAAKLVNDFRFALDLCREHGLHARAIEAVGSWFSQFEDDLSALASPCVPICIFTPDHIFIDRDKTTVVDFDETGCGWPGQSLAIFIAHGDLKTGLGAALSQEELHGYFLRSYMARTGFGEVHRQFFEVFYLLEFLETFAAPWDPNLKTSTPLARSYIRWKARVAARHITERTKAGKWRTVLG
jgi:hypothetical protein